MTLLWLLDAAELGSVLANETSYFYVVFVTSDCVTCLDRLSAHARFKQWTGLKNILGSEKTKEEEEAAAVVDVPIEVQMKKFPEKVTWFLHVTVACARHQNQALV